jgi:hypothetical protein
MKPKRNKDRRNTESHKTEGRVKGNKQKKEAAKVMVQAH